FQRQSYWIADRVAEGGASFGDGIPSGSKLLGNKANTSSKKFSIYNSRISTGEPSYLSGHKVFGKAVFPGAGFAELMLAAASEAFSNASIKLESLKFHEALFFEEDKPVNIQTIFTQTDKSKGEIGISSLNANASWTLHATAKARSVSNTKSKTPSADTDAGRGKSIDISEFYQNARSEGIDYTGAFERLKDIRIEKQSVTAVAALEEGERADGYHLHPALLDMAFQAALAGLLRNRKAVYVPSSVAGITFYKSPSREITITAEPLTGVSKSRSELYDILIADADGTLCAEIKKLKLTEVSKENFAGTETGKCDMFYQIIWRQLPESKVKKLAFDPGRAVPSGRDIEKILRHSADGKSLMAYAESVHRLDETAAHFILSALHSSGTEVNSGTRISIDEIRRKAGVSPKHEKLFARLLEILTEKELAVVSDGWLSFSEDAAALLENVPVTNDAASDDPAVNEQAFVIQCGRRLKEVLTDETDALEVLFPGGDFTAAGNIYRHSPGFETMNRIISKTLNNIQRSLSGGRKLRVLELGAGTGSTSIYALKDLRPSRTEYVFTDISPSFFEKAKELLKDRKDVEFRTLDIEKDPSSQGFADESFDVIIASNVIHAVKDVKESLAHIRKLLRKGGALILNEATVKRAWIDLTFGMTEGWWRFADNVRQGHPLLSEEKWKRVMENSGFENFTSLTHEDEDGKCYSGQNVIIAQRDNENAEHKRRVNVIISDTEQDVEMTKEIIGLFGETVTAVDSPEFVRISDTEFKAPLSSPEGVKELFEEEAIVGAGSLCVVYIAGNRNAVAGGEVYEEALWTSSALLNITKCIKESGVPAGLRVVTSNAIGAVSDDRLEGLHASPLWGMCKVIDLEHPELKTRIADADNETGMATVLHEMLSEDDEKFTAFRNGKKLTARIEKSVPAGRHNFHPKKNFAYLVTGGFSGIGLLTARMLADLGAKNIILAGRRGTSPEAEALKHELAERRIRVFNVKADVSKPEDIEDIFDIAEEGGVKIKGIIHSAGLLDDAVVMNQTGEKFRKVFEPKVRSALLLHDRTKKSGLQFFVMYSSIAAVLGSAGQSNHSAANAFLDSFSRYIHSKGLNSMSINWGVWSEIGSAAERGADRQEKISGIETISPGEGIDALRKVFDTNMPQLGVFKVNWSRYNAAVSNSLTCELTSEEAGDGTSSAKKKAKESLAEKLSHTEVKDQSALLQDYFRNLISSIMGLEPEDIEPDIPLSSMGLDSLMAIELKNRVNLELGVNLNLVRYMEETDINRLSEELKEQIPTLMSRSGLSASKETAVPKAPTESDKARDILANLDELSEEELDKLLKEMN
ncbi:MAG: SDR family NAD(P)-dependent oxidoreductase, partial [Ignavibacteria bacterium]|nr:SDR family NAD(P)-dependent oxidoreductase [Ignavibacteria bacterium]